MPVYTLLWKQTQSAFCVFSVYKLSVLVFCQKVPWKWQKHHMGCWLRLPTEEKKKKKKENHQLKKNNKKRIAKVVNI